MAKVRHTTSSNANFGPLGAAAWDADHEVSVTLTDVLSLPEELAALSAAHQSLVDRVSANSGVGGGGSVTSVELNAVSVAAQSAINTVSNAVSVLSQANSVDHAALSARITSVAGLGGGGSVTSAEAQGISAAAQSAINTVSAAVNVVSNALSVETAARIAAVDTVSNAVSALSQANSAAHASINGRIDTVSNALSVEIADRASAVNVVSQALSVLSQANSAAHVSIDGRVTSVANAVSVLSQALSVLSQANSAAHVSIDGRVTSVANAISVVSNALSALSQTNSVDHAALSNRITSVAGLGGGGSVTSAEVFNAISSLADRVSANSGVGGGGGSVTSQEMSVADAALSVRVDSVYNLVSNLNSDLISIENNLSDMRSDHIVLSDKVSNVLSGLNALSNTNSVDHAALSLRIDSAQTANSNYASVASNAASVASNAASVASNAASIAVQAASVASAAALALNAPQIRIVSNTQSTAGSALVDISGLVLTVAADQTWEIEGMLLLSTSAATVGLKAGCSVPVLSLPRYMEFARLSTGQSAGFLGGGGLMQVSGTSQFLSAANVGGVLVGARYYALFNVASAGTFRMQYGGTASTAASPVHIMPGSYMKAIRLK